MIGVSGIRGVIGTGFSPGMALDFVQAYAAWLKNNGVAKPKILLARDTRPSGEMMQHAVLAGLIGTGCDIVDLGIVSTPTLQLAIPKLEADGAICITASHNPVEWNALKFFQSNGMYLDKAQGEAVLELHKTKDYVQGNWDQMGTVSTCDEAIDWHLQRILEFVDVEAIRARHFNVVLDCCCGAGTTISPLLLDELGCSVAKINCDLTGRFPHNPEPLNENLTQLCDAVKEHQADIGFAHDADADRVALVTDEGLPIGEDYSLVWATAHTFKNKKRGPVVTNLSTTMAIDALGREYSCDVFRSPVGDVNVSSMMKEKNAVIGGEGNGGVIMPDMQFGRDGIAALAYLLEFVALSGKSASELNKKIPRYFNIKKTIEFPKEKMPQLFQWLKSKERTARFDERDGLKLEWPRDGHTTSWAHIRGSGTEPIMRVICEAQTQQEVERLVRKICEEIEIFEQSW